MGWKHFDIGWVEDGSTYSSLQQVALLPEEERPGEMEALERSGLASVLIDGQSLLIADLAYLAPATAGVGYLLVLSGIPVYLLWRWWAARNRALDEIADVSAAG